MLSLSHVSNLILRACDYSSRYTIRSVSLDINALLLSFELKTITYFTIMSAWAKMSRQEIHERTMQHTPCASKRGRVISNVELEWRKRGPKAINLTQARSKWIYDLWMQPSSTLNWTLFLTKALSHNTKTSIILEFISISMRSSWHCVRYMSKYLFTTKSHICHIFLTKVNFYCAQRVQRSTPSVTPRSPLTSLVWFCDLAS